MSENDTVRLLRQCGAGAKMGVASIDGVIGSVENDALHALLRESKKRHEQLHSRAAELLSQLGSEDKEPNPVARGMSFMKTGMKMMSQKPDAAAADLIVDGCNMGVKSLARYLNQYPTAQQPAKDVASELIVEEEGLAKDVRPYL